MTSTRQHRSGVSGANSLRRKLRRMPDEVDKNIRPTIEEGAQNIARTMRFLTPVDEGETVRRIRFKVSRNGLTARIGVIYKPDARKVFYFTFLDKGTKGDPKRNIPPMEALHIREQSIDSNRLEILNKLATQINKTFKEVSRG